MPARRTSRDLKIKLSDRDLHAADPAKDADLGGLGLTWDDAPTVLDESGRVEWQRLSRVFADNPTRFRESDRAAVTAYSIYWSAFIRAAEDVARRGPVFNKK
jgi:phage terminase small subunit